MAPWNSKRQVLQFEEWDLKLQILEFETTNSGTKFWHQILA